MKGKRMWQGFSDSMSGYIQVCESSSGEFFIRTSSYCSSGGAFRHKPRYRKWKPLELRASSIKEKGRKIITSISNIGKVRLTQIGGAYRLRLPN